VIFLAKVMEKHMNLKMMAAAVTLALSATACQAIPEDMTVAQYCAQPDKANMDVCKINVEIDGERRQLADTNMRLSQARTIADNALARANSAQASADAALVAATEAKSQAAFNCTTKTVQRSKTGSCGEGYKVQSCVQTRFTFNAGAPSILREITDTGCRFNDQVLEMQIRCCTTGPAPVMTETAAPVDPQPTAPKQPAQSS
jgi:hypothetical protein